LLKCDAMIFTIRVFSLKFFPVLFINKWSG